MLRLQKPVPWVDLIAPAACAGLMKPGPTAMVSVVAAVAFRKLRRLKSIDLKFGMCMQPIRSHMVSLPAERLTRSRGAAMRC